MLVLGPTGREETGRCGRSCIEGLSQVSGRADSAVTILPQGSVPPWDQAGRGRWDEGVRDTCAGPVIHEIPAFALRRLQRGAVAAVDRPNRGVRGRLLGAAGGACGRACLATAGGRILVHLAAFSSVVRHLLI